MLYGVVHNLYVAIFIDLDHNHVYANHSLVDVSSRKNSMNCIDETSLSKYYCNKESIRETFQRSYINQIEMDEIMTYAYSSDDNDYKYRSHTMKDSDEDSLGN